MEAEIPEVFPGRDRERPLINKKKFQGRTDHMSKEEILSFRERGGPPISFTCAGESRKRRHSRNRCAVYSRFPLFVLCLIGFIIAVAGNGRAASIDLPWTVEYRADTLPQTASPTWTKTVADNVYLTNEVTYTVSENSALSILQTNVVENTISGTNCITCHNPTGSDYSPASNFWPLSYTINDSSLSNTIGTTVEARLWFPSNLSPASLGLAISDGTYSETLRISASGIKLSLFGSNVSYSMNTTDGYHVYRMTLKGATVTVYVDGALVLTGSSPISFVSPYGTSAQYIKFGQYTGHGTASPGADADWDYVKYFNGVTSSANFNADFNADTIGAEPGLSPAGPPAGDFITLQFDTMNGNSMLVQGAVGDLTGKPLEISKTDGIDNTPTFEGHPDPAFGAYMSGIYIVTWKSLSEQSNGGNGFASLVDSTNYPAFTVNYASDGTIVFQDGTGQINTGVSYTANVSQTFQAVVDLDNQVFDLYIDGVRVGYRQPFQFSQFTGIDRFIWEIGGAGSEAYAIDDISIGTRIFSEDFSADTQGQAPNSIPRGIPAGDYITLQNAQAGGNSMLVQADVGDLDFALDIVKSAAGNAPTFEAHPDPVLGPYTSGSYLIRWKSLAEQSNGANGSASLVDSFGHPAFTVNYAADGTIVFQDGTGQITTGIPYAPYTSQTFEAVVDLDRRVFDLYIDGVQAGTQQTFQDVLFDALDRFVWRIGGGAAEAYAIGDISISFQRTPCSLSLLPTGLTGISPFGGPGFNFQVTASDQICYWTASSGDPWISGISGGGTGDGMVYYNVSANTGSAERTGSINVGGQSFILTQAACTYTFTPAGQSGVSSAGGSGFSFNVTASDRRCTWTASTSNSWLVLVSAGPNLGNGTVVYNVSQNFGPARGGTIGVGGQTFTVTQNSGCGFILTPSLKSGVSPSGGTGFSFQVVASSSLCNWTANSNEAWITGVTPAGTGTGAVTYNVSPNTAAARTGTISAAGRTFTVSQGAGCAYTITPGSPSPADFGAGAGSGTFTVSASGSQCSWAAASSDASWLTTTSSGAGSGSGSYTVATNAGPARTGTISVGGQFFAVTQASGCSYTIAPVSPNPANFGTGAGSGTFSVTASNGQCSWAAASSDSSWLTTTSMGAGSGGGSYAVAPNTGPARSGTISAGGKSFTVTQSSPTTIIINASAGTGGGISPFGIITAARGSSMTFYITPAGGFVLTDVLVDGRSMGPLYAITFMNLTDNHTITATFAPR
jgi:hypothetical protein